MGEFRMLLTSFDVGRSYRSFDVYFPDPSRSVLVPDQLLLPVGPGVSTSLVRALLEALHEAVCICGNDFHGWTRGAVTFDIAY